MTAAIWPSARTACSTSRWATAAAPTTPTASPSSPLRPTRRCAARNRSSATRSTATARSSTRRSARSCASTSIGRRTRATASTAFPRTTRSSATPGAVPEIWALRLPQPLPLLLRSQDRRPLRRRRRPERHRGGRHRHTGGNYGWNRKEGTAVLLHQRQRADDGFAEHRSDPTGARCPRRPAIDPIAQYDTHHEGHSVVGGFVYHGDDVPALRGSTCSRLLALFKFPFGPHDYGRLFFLQQKQGTKLRQINEFQSRAKAGSDRRTRRAPRAHLGLSLLGLGRTRPARSMRSATSTACRSVRTARFRLVPTG